MRLVHRGEYPPDWDEIGDRVRAEAGNRCIRCGHPQGDKPSQFMACTEHCTHPRDGKMRILTVHHLDGNKANCAWWNLLSLCQSCHLIIQAKVIPERPYLWEHKDWFKPYAAGFYAWQRGYDVTRDDIERQIPFYLSLGQPWLAEAANAS